MLEVAVGDATGWVVGGDQVPLHVQRKRVTPEVRLVFVVEVDPTHAHLGGVRSAGERGFFGDYLSEVGCPVAQASSERGECVDVVPQGLGDANAVVH